MWVGAVRVFPLMSKTSDISVPPPIVVLVGWLVPGAGYWLIGQRARALTVGITIFLLFGLGLLIGGMKVVDPPASYANPLNILLQKPWFVGQVLAGPMTLVTAGIGKGEAFFMSHSRVNEIGTLYTAVAGMLNLLAIIDSAYRAGRRGES
jgi:hypothetical protein